MNREQIISDLQQYFSIQELVCDHVYKRWKEQAWQFLDTRFLHCLLVIRRDILKVPMVCNDSAHHQRGIRCNVCELVSEKDGVYMSAHILGKAGDFVSGKMSADKMRNEIKKQHALLPYPIRIEKGVSWLHFDVLEQYGIHQKVYEFSA